jgi:2'-5' RNA ligase
MSETHRAFWAIEIPEIAREQIAQVSADWQKQYPKQHFRWTKSENYHLTLRYLGNISPEVAEQLSQQVAKALSTLWPFELCLTQVSLFPPQARAHALVMIAKPSDALLQTQQAVERVVLQQGFKAERHGFIGHVTLARINKQRLPQSVENELMLKQAILIPVQRVVLYYSQPDVSGSHYTPIKIIQLNNL